MTIAMIIKYIAHVIQYFEEGNNNILPRWLGITSRYSRRGAEKVFMDAKSNRKE